MEQYQIDGDVLAAMFSQKDMEILTLRSQLKAALEHHETDHPDEVPDNVTPINPES